MFLKGRAFTPTKKRPTHPATRKPFCTPVKTTKRNCPRVSTKKQKAGAPLTVRLLERLKTLRTRRQTRGEHTLLPVPRPSTRESPVRKSNYVRDERIQRTALSNLTKATIEQIRYVRKRTPKPTEILPSVNVSVTRHSLLIPTSQRRGT